MASQTVRGATLQDTGRAGYLTTHQAAAYLNVSISTLRGWVRTKGVPYHKPSKTLLFRTKDIDAWMRRYRYGDKGLALMGFNDRMTGS